MTDPKTHYSCAELAALALPTLPATVQGIRKFLKAESWPFEVVKGVGGKGGEQHRYAPPPAFLAVIRAREKELADQVLAEQKQALLARLEVERQARLVEKHRKAQEQLAALHQLTPKAAEKLQHHTAIVAAWRSFAAEKGLLRRKRTESFDQFATAYNTGGIAVDEAVRKDFEKVSPRSLSRWVLAYENGNTDLLVDRRHRKIDRPSHIEATPLLAIAIKKLLVERPGLAATHAHDLLVTASTDPATGTRLFAAPSYHQVVRFQAAWIRDNDELYLAATNPDEWKNKYMVAFGDAAADVEELNQRWEMDATPFEFELKARWGGKRRYHGSVVVDIFSRRTIVRLSRTSKARAHCATLRAALLKWGIPKQVLTDNGKDYQANHFRQVLSSLDIEHLTTAPFSPWEKPHIERAIQTLNHGIVEAYSNFLGHNVSERQAIEARQSFADRLFNKEKVVTLDMTAEELQELLEDWLLGTYEHKEHDGIGMSPFSRVASWKGPVHHIENERALDMLLAPPAGGGTRIVQKKGIHIDGAWYIALPLATNVGRTVTLYESEDLGQVVVYLDGKFLCVATCTSRLGIKQKEIAKTARKMQAERVTEGRRLIRNAGKQFNVDELVTRTIRDNAVAAGKLALLPKPSVPYTTPALEEAAKAADALAGKIAPPELPSDIRVYQELKAAQAAKAAGEPPPPPLPPSEIPETPELRFRLWTELSERFVDGVPPEIELSQRLRTWLFTYPKSPEYRGLQRRYQQQKETGNPPASGLPVDLSLHRKQS